MTFITKSTNTEQLQKVIPSGIDLDDYIKRLKKAKNRSRRNDRKHAIEIIISELKDLRDCI